MVSGGYQAILGIQNVFVKITLPIRYDFIRVIDAV
jgi:hypothetical protein